MRRFLALASVVVVAAATAHPSAGRRDQQPPAAAATPTPTPEAMTAALSAYNGRLVDVSASRPAAFSLVDVVVPVMALARTRSASADPVVENQAALVALVFYVNRWPLEWAIPEARSWPRPAPRTATLRGRHDLAQHFTVSAVIAAAAGTPIAAAAGLYKELSDARGGSGFSFSDLAADQAGTRFGQVATRSADSARRLQAALTSGLAEDAIMPAITGLVDNLTQAEFVSRFGGIGAPAYGAVMQDIEARVAALPLLQ